MVDAIARSSLKNLERMGTLTWLMPGIRCRVDLLSGRVLTWQVELKLARRKTKSGHRIKIKPLFRLVASC